MRVWQFHVKAYECVGFCFFFFLHYFSFLKLQTVTLLMKAIVQKNSSSFWKTSQAFECYYLFYAYKMALSGSFSLLTLRGRYQLHPASIL